MGSVLVFHATSGTFVHLLLSLDWKTGPRAERECSEHRQGLKSQPVVILGLLAVSHFFPSICLAFQHSLPRVDKEKEDGVRDQNWCVTELRPTVVFVQMNGN